MLVLNTIEIQSCDDLLKLIGLACSSNVWKDNAEYLYMENKMSLGEIPTYREELYTMIYERLCNNGIFDDGLAYEVMEKARRGYYAKAGEVDEYTALSLLQIGFERDFIFFLEKINYMPSKAQGVSCLKYLIATMYYKLKYNKEYKEIIADNTCGENGNV